MFCVKLSVIQTVYNVEIIPLIVSFAITPHVDIICCIESTIRKVGNVSQHSHLTLKKQAYVRTQELVN